MLKTKQNTNKEATRRKQTNKNLSDPKTPLSLATSKMGAGLAGTCDGECVYLPQRKVIKSGLSESSQLVGKAVMISGVN